MVLLITSVATKKKHSRITPNNTTTNDHRQSPTLAVGKEDGSGRSACGSSDVPIAAAADDEVSFRLPNTESKNAVQQDGLEAIDVSSSSSSSVLSPLPSVPVTVAATNPSSPLDLGMIQRRRGDDDEDSHRTPQLHSTTTAATTTTRARRGGDLLTQERLESTLTDAEHPEKDKVDDLRGISRSDGEDKANPDVSSLITTPTPPTTTIAETPSTKTLASIRASSLSVLPSVSQAARPGASILKRGVSDKVARSPTGDASPSIGRQGRPSTERRVRGIWSNNNVTIIAEEEGTFRTTREPQSNTPHRYSPFDSIRDETLTVVLEYLDLADLLRAGMACRRWRHGVKHESCLWKRIDASSFCQEAYRNFRRVRQIQEAERQALQVSGNPPTSGGRKVKKITPSRWAQEQTGKALQKILQNQKPVTLIISGIHNALCADHFHIPTQLLASLQELTLTHFENLSDTHLHVLLLMTLGGGTAPGGAFASADVMKQKKKSKGKSHNSLRVLKLEHCPLLTNSSLQSIVTTCYKYLGSLSLHGNAKITQVSALQDLFVTTLRSECQVQQSSSGLGRAKQEQQQTGLNSLFSSPGLIFPNLFQQPVTPIAPHSCLPSMPSSLTPPGESKASSVASLFATPQLPNIQNRSSPPPEKAGNGSNIMSSLFPPPHLLPAATAPTRAPTTMASLFSPPPPRAKPTKVDASSSMASLFGPPPRATPPANIMSSLFTPPRTSSYPTCHGTQKVMTAASSIQNPDEPTRNSSPIAPTTPSVHTSSSLTSLFSPPGSSPPRKTTTLVLHPSLDSDTSADAPANSNIRRYHRHQRSLSNSYSSIRTSVATLATTTVGSLKRLDMRETGVLPRDLVDCLWDIASHFRCNDSTMSGSCYDFDTDLWCWLCFKALYVTPPSSADPTTTSHSYSWTRQDLRRLEQVLMMEECEELHLGNTGGFVGRFVAGGNKSKDWQQLENLLIGE